MNEQTDCFSFSSEPKWKTMARKLLRAYWKHRDIQEPSKVEVFAGWGLEPRKVAADAIITRCEVTVSWLDLIRCALGCKLQVNTITYCEKGPGRTKAETEVFTFLK